MGGPPHYERRLATVIQVDLKVPDDGGEVVSRRRDERGGLQRAALGANSVLGRAKLPGAALLTPHARHQLLVHLAFPWARGAPDPGTSVEFGARACAPEGSVYLVDAQEIAAAGFEQRILDDDDVLSGSGSSVEQFGIRRVSEQ